MTNCFDCCLKGEASGRLAAEGNGQQLTLATFHSKPFIHEQ